MAEQRPLPGAAGEAERGVTSRSHLFEELRAHSANPPEYRNPAYSASASPPLAPKPLALEWPYAAAALPAGATADDVPGLRQELDSRLVIAIAMGVHSGNTKVAEQGLVSLPVFNTLLPTILKTLMPHHVYR